MLLNAVKEFIKLFEIILAQDNFFFTDFTNLQVIIGVVSVYIAMTIFYESMR